MSTQPRTKASETPIVNEVIPVIGTQTQTEEQIRARAYQLYEQRGMKPGHELEDWLQAEAELVAPSKAAA